MVTPIYYLGVAESPTIEIPQAELSALLSQIEAELHSSKVYRSALASLQLLGETSPTATALVKAVGREAIRLVFLKLARRHDKVPVQTGVSTVPPDVSTTEADVQPEDALESGPSIINTSSQSSEVVSSCVDATPRLEVNMPQKRTLVAERTKKTRKAEAAQIAIQERAERLRNLGQELQQARYSQGLSLRQLHERSLVPLHHIEALENGRVDLLPEDVYVRGFIRRLGDVLGLDGVGMNDSLPTCATTVLPSWYRSQSVSGLHLSPLHLYLGYTALVAGAVGGLALLSQQSTLSDSIHQMTKPSQPLGTTGQQPGPMMLGIKSSHAGVAFSSGIAPLESFEF